MKKTTKFNSPLFSNLNVGEKIKDLKLATSRIEINEKIYSRMLTDEETREKYKGLKEYHIDNLLQKYVKLEENNGTVN